MNVSLSTDLENFVNERVKSGAFKSESDVIAEALRALQEREAEIAEEREWLRKELQIGIDQIRRGEVVSGDEAREYLRQRRLARKGAATK